MLAGRRHARYPVSLRLRLQLPGGELETTTEDVSLAGFSAPCASLPEVGTSFGFVVHLPDGHLVSGQASAIRISAEGLAGFACEFGAEHQQRWQEFLAQEQSSGGVWRMLARYTLGNSDDHEAARSVLEKGRFGLLFRRLGEKPQTTDRPVVMRLHMVGENGEAWRIAFERHDSITPELHFSNAPPKVREFLAKAVKAVLHEDVCIKRSARAHIEGVRLVEFTRGGFGFVHDVEGKPTLVGLHGSELIVTEIDGKPVFPFFEAADLERIASDTFRRTPEGQGVVAPLKEDRFAAAYTHTIVDTQARQGITEREVREAMQVSQRVQTRTYGTRTLRLFPDLWLEAQRSSWPAPVRGFAVEDGAALCIFVLVGANAPRVVRLEPTDVVSLIRG